MTLKSLAQEVSELGVLSRFLIGALTTPLALLALAWLRWNVVFVYIILVLTAVASVFGIAVLILAFKANAENKELFTSLTVRLAVASTFSPIWLLPFLIVVFSKNYNPH